MEELGNQYIKRTQKDYSMSFKLAVIAEVESGAITNRGAMRKYGIQGHGTITEWHRKYCNFDPDNRLQVKAMQSPQQKIKELEQKLRQLERQNKFLEEELVRSEDKAAILDKVIELAEKEYHIPVRKNSYPDQSEASTKRSRKR